MAAIELRALRKEFGDTVAVDSVDLQIDDGEFLVLVGPSGCGKSTLLRTIAGLESVSDGELYFDDELVNDIAPKDRGVSMVFQNYALYPHMSARKNMTFGLGSHGSYSKQERERMVTDVSEMLGIADLLDRKPAALSGGEKQRVAIGRALLREPDVFLLDEPLSNLDAKLKDEMRTELTRLHKRIETTTLYVTHDQTEAMTLGDHVAVMRDGNVVQVDRPQQLWDYPNSRFVAEFIGSPRINVVDASATTTGDTLHVRTDLWGMECPIPETADQIDGEVVLGVRPENVHLEKTTEMTGLSDPIETEVTVREPLGDSMLVHGKTEDEEIRIQTDARTEIQTGETIRVAIDPNNIHLFDAASGAALYHADPKQSKRKPTIEAED